MRARSLPYPSSRFPTCEGRRHRAPGRANETRQPSRHWRILSESQRPRFERLTQAAPQLRSVASTAQARQEHCCARDRVQRVGFGDPQSPYQWNCPLSCALTPQDRTDDHSWASKTNLSVHAFHDLLGSSGNHFRAGHCRRQEIFAVLPRQDDYERADPSPRDRVSRVSAMRPRATELWERRLGSMLTHAQPRKTRTGLYLVALKFSGNGILGPRDNPRKLAMCRC